MIKTLSPAIFGIALLCFFLPWVTASCGGQKVMTFSGFDLSIGKTISVPQGFTASKKETAREFYATIALLAVISGIAIRFLMVEQAQRIPSAVCGVISFMLLLLLKGKLDRDIFTQGSGMMALDFHFGYWMSVILSFVAGTLNILSITGHLEKFTGTNNNNVISESPTTASFCPKCGVKVSSANTFCSECGASLK